MSSRTTNTEGAPKSVPFNKILVDPKRNSRRGKLRNIPELAKNIDANGLNSSLLVTNGGSADQPYTLFAGFRRAAALELLKWGSKPVNVIVVDDGKGMGANLIENVLREPLPALDLAQRLSEMKEGTYYDPNAEEGTEKRKWTVAQLAETLSKSQSHITNLIRVHESITDDVKDLVGAYDPPGRLLFVWAGKSPDKQMEMAKAWIAYAKGLEAGGRKRKVKGSGGKETSNSSKPSKKELTTRYEMLSWKAESSKGKEAEIAAAAANVLKFVLGEVARFPTEVFSGEDKKAYDAAQKAAAKEAEEEEAAE